MEVASILVKRKPPSALFVQAFERTQWVYLAELVLQEIGCWSSRSRRHDESLPFSPASAMMSLRMMIDRERAKRLRITVAFVFLTEVCVGKLSGSKLEI